jgi:hypothetical protein
MALTSAEALDVRRFLGVAPGTPDAVLLEATLAALTIDGEVVVRASFLDPLRKLEAAMVESALDADTLKAGPWTRNVNAGAELNNAWAVLRSRLAGFLGVLLGSDAGAAVPNILVV